MFQSATPLPQSPAPEPGLPRVHAATSHVARVGRAHLHYRMAGAGTPLVLIHGYSGASTWWRRNMAGLAAHHRVYALDLAGFGRSRPKRHFSLEQAVEDIVQWMAALGLERASFCGHSMGGQVCIRLAATYPERVHRLVLADASGLPLGARVPRLAWRGLRSSGHTHFRFAPTVVQSAVQAGPLVLWSALRDLLADNVEEMLGRISAPTLIVWGERDVLVPPALGRVLHRAIPNSRLVVVPGAGHNVMYECPAQFNRLVLDFLA